MSSVTLLVTSAILECGCCELPSLDLDELGAVAFVCFSDATDANQVAVLGAAMLVLVTAEAGVACSEFRCHRVRVRVNQHSVRNRHEALKRERDSTHQEDLILTHS